jgi:hypothetical protein
MAREMKDWDDLPDPPDEDDPDFQDYRFTLYQMRGVRLEEFQDKKERNAYRKWLATKLENGEEG